jgi:two-component system, OmpR family, response regulator CpxR
VPSEPVAPRRLTEFLERELRVDRHRPQLRIADVTLDPAARIVLVAASPVHLTTIEFDMLHVLLEFAGQTVARDKLGEIVLGRKLEPLDRCVDVHISKIRRKLGPRPGGEDRIKTIRSAGYMYTLPLAGAVADPRFGAE